VSAPGGDLLTDRAALGDDLAPPFERVAFQDGRCAPGGNGLGPGLDQVELPVGAVLGPLDVHRPTVMVLDRDRLPAELENLGVGEAVPVPVCFGGGDVAGALVVSDDTCLTARSSA
jgi:hypothetical protein